MIRLLIVIISVYASLSGQAKYNHPELEWFTFETEHFNIHYHNGTERSAREAATVAETIFPKITQFYDFIPEDKTLISATTDYSSNIVCSVEKENIFGTQFHPEKSDKTGLKIIDNFISL